MRLVLIRHQAHLGRYLDRRGGGMRERKNEKMAIAKAMSVAIGTASAASDPLQSVARVGLGLRLGVVG